MSVAIPIPLLQHLPDVNVTPAVGVDEYALTYDHGTASFVLRAPFDGTPYALLAGRAGGQTLYGGTGANDDITIHGTSDGTRTTSYVILQPSGGNVGIGTAAPATALHVVGAATITAGIRPAADSTIALQLQNVAGTSVLNVDTTNARVGIGTSAPKLALEAKGDDSYAANAGATASGVVRIVTPNNVAIDFGAKGDVSPYPAWIQVHDSVNQATAYPLALQPNGGNVGIGTTSPGAYLDITGATGLAKIFRARQYSAATYDGNYNFEFQGSMVSGTANGMLIKHNENDATRDILVLANSAGPTVTFESTGNVGIGTTSPGAKLTLQSSAPTAGDAVIRLQTASGGITTGTTIGDVEFYTQDDSTGGTGTYAKMRAVSEGLFNGTANTNVGLSFWTTLSGSMAEAVRIDKSGNVGIGDIDPAEKLDVTGNINATGVYKVDDVQVLSNRVIDARCADVANSGDATTDGLIDALRDAMVAHGLIAAA